MKPRRESLKLEIDRLRAQGYIIAGTTAVRVTPDKPPASSKLPGSVLRSKFVREPDNSLSAAYLRAIKH